MRRIAYLDMVKLVTIYLVILGHVLAMMVNGYQVGGRLINFIYSFHMPLFMIVSGYFASSRSLERPFGEFLIVKAQQLLLPAISCTFICCIYLFLSRDTVNYRDEIIGNSWFLKTLFVYYVLFWLIKHIGLNDWGVFVVSCLFLFLIPKGATLQINLLWPYFLGGYFIRKHKVLERLKGKWIFTIILTLTYICTYALQRHFNIPNYIPVNTLSIASQWHHILFRYLVAFSGSMSVILLIALVYSRMANTYKFLEKGASYGKYTLGVYTLQTILVANIFPDTLAWHVDSEIMLDAVISPALSIGFLVLCLWLILVISKNKALDLMFFGGQYYKR